MNSSISQTELVRIKKLIDGVILQFDLDLKGLTVLTEAASGYYFVTAIIAARAGATVLAYAKNSKYGQAQEIIKSNRKMAKYFHEEKNINFIDKLTSEIIGSADIVTNSGFLRPINRKFIGSMKKTAVIPLMYELWELRKDDIDVLAAQENNIIVAGTNEDAPDLVVFDFVKPLILKMLFEAGLEIYQNNFLLISGDKFGQVIENVLKKMGARVFLQNPKLALDLKKLPPRLDGIIVAAYNYPVDIGLVKKHFSETKIIQFFQGHNMAKTFSDLGPLPVINLHAASLKVGEEVARARLGGKNALELKKNKLIQLKYWAKNVSNS